MLRNCLNVAKQLATVRWTWVFAYTQVGINFVPRRPIITKLGRIDYVHTHMLIR